MYLSEHRIGGVMAVEFRAWGHIGGEQIKHSVIKKLNFLSLVNYKMKNDRRERKSVFKN